MILLAINKAAESGKRSWNYINGILSNWQHSGVHTPGDAAASDENHKRPTGRAGSPRQPAESTRDQLARVLGNMDKERGFET
jgi:DNA replication protein DnaD